MVLDSTEVMELPGAEVQAENTGKEEAVEANSSPIMELPTPHNERAELDSCQIGGKIESVELIPHS